MSRRLIWTTIQAPSQRDDVMTNDSVALAGDKDPDGAAEKDLDEESSTDDDWISDWRPPSLDALSILLLATELETSGQRKPN